MKGILFNVAEEVVEQHYGAETWERMLDASGVEGAYTALGNYPDSEFADLVAAAATILSVPEADVVRALGRGAIPLLATRYADFFTGHTSARTFVLTLNEIIHPEVRKLYPGSQVPEFDFDDGGADGDLVIGYRSSRQLCVLAEGFLLGAADHYGESVTVQHDSCTLQGDDACTLRCHFTAQAP